MLLILNTTKEAASVIVSVCSSKWLPLTARLYVLMEPLEYRMAKCSFPESVKCSTCRTPLFPSKVDQWLKKRGPLPSLLACLTAGERKGGGGGGEREREREREREKGWGWGDERGSPNYQ